MKIKKATDTQKYAFKKKFKFQDFINFLEAAQIENKKITQQHKLQLQIKEIKK